VEKYLYSFVVWPSEGFPHSRALFTYFRVFRRRTEMRLTEAEWEAFRSEMTSDGFSLREVTRVPFVEPESVY
jgi:hypothetical protein